MEEIIKVENKVERVTLEKLKEYFNPQYIVGFCKNCNSYGRIWSCPPYDFDVENYIDKFKYIYIIGTKVYLNANLQKKDDVGKTLPRLFEGMKSKLDFQLLKIEDSSTKTTALFPGSCSLCNNCTRTFNKPCIKPKDMRYSLESLGFDVSSICTNILNEELLWTKDKLPKYFMLVSGVLSNDDELDVNKNMLSKIKS